MSQLEEVQVRKSSRTSRKRITIKEDNLEEDEDIAIIIPSDDEGDIDWEDIPVPKKKSPKKNEKPTASTKRKAAADGSVPKRKRATKKKDAQEANDKPVDDVQLLDGVKLENEDVCIKDEQAEMKPTGKSTKRKAVPKKAPAKKRKSATGLPVVVNENTDDVVDQDNKVDIYNSGEPVNSKSGIGKQEVGVFVRSGWRLWDEADVVSEVTGVALYIVRNVIKLFKQECTIPFIARYRKEKTGNLSAEKLREIQMAHENIKAVMKRVENILKVLPKDRADEKLLIAFMNAKTLEEVEFLYAPFKPGSKKSLAERSKKLGLEPFALDLLEGRKSLTSWTFSVLVDPKKPGISTVEEVRKGIQHIIADIVSKEREVLEFISQHPERHFIRLTASKSAAAEKEDKKAFVEGKQTQNFKFENYYQFNCPVKNISSHQVLALNRGDHLKILSVKVVISDTMKHQIIARCTQHFIRSKQLDIVTAEYIGMCIEDAYSRLLEPHITRQIRSELTKKASKESVEVFCSNLKRLLLTPPVRGKTVIGIDPGFKHGCKVAVVSCTGDVLKTDVIYPHKTQFNNGAGETLLQMVSDYFATIVAIGNGTACRETETWLSDLIQNKIFHPHDVKYCIMNENGVSIYSVTKQAESDLPDMDANLRSAVAIARRLQDPLLEYVNVEPKHLGVGMYQHDVPETMLKSALDSVVVECVSFVGVDLNVCPEILLRKISGLSATRAKQIIEWREKNGSFINRQQLLEVKGLGPKSFEQCAGFVKILPQTSVKGCSLATLKEEVLEPVKKKKKKAAVTSNLLDATVIHPESYDIAEKFLVELKADSSEIGQQSLIEKVKNHMKFNSAKTLAEQFDVPPERMQLIIDVFMQPLEYDIREEFEVPLFQTGVKCLEDIKVNQVLTGRVTNVTHFGAFVDIGVGPNGLIHTSKMNNKEIHLGDRISVKVLSVDVSKQKIALSVEKDCLPKNELKKSLLPSSESTNKNNKANQKSFSQTANRPPENSNMHKKVLLINPAEVKKRLLEPFEKESAGKSIWNIKVDQILTGHVTGINHLGAFVDIGINNNGLIRMSNMRNMQLLIGDRVCVRVLDVDILRKRISLELIDNLKSKTEFEDTGQREIKSINDIYVGLILPGQVRNITNYGAFVDIGIGSSGLLHVSKMWNRQVYAGDHILVKVLSVNAAAKKVSLGLHMGCS